MTNKMKVNVTFAHASASDKNTRDCSENFLDTTRKHIELTWAKTVQMVVMVTIITMMTVMQVVMNSMMIMITVPVRTILMAILILAIIMETICIRLVVRAMFRYFYDIPTLLIHTQRTGR